ncbi:PCC domain-containing protein [Pararhodobacter sp.]|uniref:PCC domain-containing protein n=1 Tax=Pararhodobacter sp. TaxID=2127056 RepID=UPI002FDD5389
MTARLRRIQHPGAPASERLRSLPCHAAPLRLTLPAGQSLAEAVPQAFARAGFAFGYLRLDGADFAPLNFVTPAPAPGDGHAAWYSATHHSSAARARHAGVHLGLRDGKPFLHCHGIWDGTPPDAGHMLCEDSILAQDCTVAGWGLKGAGLVASHDRETDFTLFRPERQGDAPIANAFLITLRPNQDISAALLAFAQEHRITAAQIEGIGSLVGTAFSDGRMIESYATEILVVQGRLQDDALSLQIAAVGFDGRCQSGTLAAGANAVCVTAEILLLGEPLSPA